MTASAARRYVSPHEVTAAWSGSGGDRVVRVVVDAAGGDNAPAEVVRGALAAAGSQTHVVLVGDEAVVRPLVPAGTPHVSVVHAPDVIGSRDAPATAARNRTESSIVVGLKLVHAG
jgi:glycerol-3-phosphate acyltransferase PlsX